jgi:hypothetical protein
MSVNVFLSFLVGGLIDSSPYAVDLAAFHGALRALRLNRAMGAQHRCDGSLAFVLGEEQAAMPDRCNGF